MWLAFLAAAVFCALLMGSPHATEIPCVSGEQAEAFERRLENLIAEEASCHGNERGWSDGDIEEFHNEQYALALTIAKKRIEDWHYGKSMERY